MSSELRTHGGVHPPGALDFSVNISPFGVPERVAAAIRAADLTRYPDPTAREVRAAWAEHLGLDADAIAFGPGAAQLLWDLARLHGGRERTALIVEPTFSEFTAAARESGARVVHWTAEESRGLRFDLDAVAARAREESASVIYLCNPNNPTGQGIALGQVARFAAELPEVVLILDEAFLFLSELSHQAATSMPPNVVRVRSMTKDLALPGLRLAYLLGAPELVREFETRRAPWSTSAPAQAAALATLEVGEELESRRVDLLERRASFSQRVRNLGLQTMPSMTTWFLARNSNAEPAADLNARLNERGFHARDCASFGLPECLRFGVRQQHEVDALLAVLPELL